MPYDNTRYLELVAEIGKLLRQFEYIRDFRSSPVTLDPETMEPSQAISFRLYHPGQPPNRLSVEEEREVIMKELYSKIWGKNDEDSTRNS